MSRKRKSSNASTPNGSEKSSETGNPQRVREFLYLDYPKITSYYAQYNRGVLSRKERIRGGEATTTVTKPTVETGFEGGIRVGAGGEELNLAKLVGIIADIQAKVTRLTTSGGEEAGRTRAEYIIEAKELHHDVFNAVELALEGSNLIETSLHRKASTRPFYRVSGTADFIDFNNFITFLDDQEKLRAAFIGLHDNDIGEVAGLEHIKYLVERFYKDRVAMFMRGDGATVTTILDPTHLTAPLQVIVDNYGRQTQIGITVFGLKVDSAKREPSSSGTGTYASDMTKAVLQVNEGLESMDAMVRLRGDIHLYPLAVFVDFDQYLRRK